MVEKIKLIKSFIDLNKLPLQPIENLDYAKYAFTEYGVLEDWEKFAEYIGGKFNSQEEYKKYYLNTKEAFLKYVKSLPGYQKFNSQDMSKFAFQFPAGVSKGNQYTENNTGKTMLSIDLKGANFQALRWCDVFPDSVQTYEDLISQFTDIPFLLRSKYLRSVLFGQLNPGRHIIVESYLVNLLRPDISDQLKLICMASDELVYEVPGDMRFTEEELGWTKQEIKQSYGLDVSAEYYKLHEYILESEKSHKEYKIYSKESLCGSEVKYKCIPNNLWLTFWKLKSGRELCDYDRWIEHDGVLSMYIENFKLYEKIVSSKN